MAEKPNKTVDGYIADLPPTQAAIVSAVCQLVREAAPEAKESIKWAQPVWEVNGPVCYVKAFKHATNFGFWRGAELAERADPDGILGGDGDRMRHVKMTSAADLRKEPLQRIVRAAIQLNQQFGDPTKGEATRARPRSEPPAPVARGRTPAGVG